MSIEQDIEQIVDALYDKIEKDDEVDLDLNEFDVFEVKEKIQEIIPAWLPNRVALFSSAIEAILQLQNSGPMVKHSQIVDIEEFVTDIQGPKDEKVEEFKEKLAALVEEVFGKSGEVKLMERHMSGDDPLAKLLNLRPADPNCN